MNEPDWGAWCWQAASCPDVHCFAPQSEDTFADLASPGSETVKGFCDAVSGTELSWYNISLGVS